MRHALHAEFSKLRTAPGTGGLLLGIVVATVAVSALAGAGVSCTPEVCGLDPVKHALTGVHLGQVLVAAFGVAVAGGEYGSGMILTTLTAVPRRLTVAAAKIVTMLAALGAASMVAVPAALLAGGAGLARHGHAFSLWDPGTVRAVFGSVGYLLVIGLLGLGIALTARNATAAIGTTLALLYLFPMLALTVTDEALILALHRVSPMDAGLSVQATVRLAELPIAPLPGLGVAAAWAAAALVVGVGSLRLRDA